LELTPPARQDDLNAASEPSGRLTGEFGRDRSLVASIVSGSCIEAPDLASMGAKDNAYFLKHLIQRILVKAFHNQSIGWWARLINGQVSVR
jgi:hypothetical protein